MKKLFTLLLSLTLLFTLATPTSAKASIKHISKATISNIAIPTPGMKVEDYIDTTTRPDVDAAKYSVANKECYWSDGSKNKLSSEASFSQNSTYYYTVVLKANGDYVFNQDATLKIKGGVVDSGTQTQIINAGKEITFKFAYKITCGVGQTQTIAGMELTKTKFYYNGKIQKPSAKQIKVTDADGARISKSNYTVKYSAGKKVGTYTVKVKGKNHATGEASTTYTINPSTPKSLKASGKKKSVKVSWKKPSSGKPDYYDILVYSDSNCKHVVTSAKIEGSRHSKTIGGLKKGKTYYVKVDCYVSSDEGYLVSKPSKAVKVKAK